MKDTESPFDALRLALDEERGKLIVAMYEMSEADLERLVKAAQLIDSEGVEILDAYFKERKAQAAFDAEFVPTCDTEGL